MIARVRGDVAWHDADPARAVAFNVSGRYVTLTVEIVLGLLMLPFNTRHLGASGYGLWMLATSIVAYFPVLELGYGAAMERFVAHNRALRNGTAINEIASTLVFVYGAIGLVALGVLTAIAYHLGAMFDLSPAQARTGGLVLLLVSLQFTLGLPFAIFGALVNGFQRTYLNSVVGTVVAITVAAVNAAVLMAGGGLVELVAATTAVRVLSYIAYRSNAYRVFPPLRIRPSLFRMTRLREVTGFSVYMLLNDAANKLNYATDPIVIAAALSTGAVAMWTVAQRLSYIVHRLTNQLGEVLFPIVVDCDTGQRTARLKDVLVHGTRLSLAMVIPSAGALALLAYPVVIGWTGQDFQAAAPVLQVLAVVVIMRVGAWTSGTVLQGGGYHRLLALTNIASAVTNVVLSVILVRTHGLLGVAYATLIPLSIRATAILAPMACRRVGMSLAAFVSRAVWPAVWPAAVVLGALAAMRDPASVSLVGAVAQGAACGLIYVMVFIGVAIGREDRARYLGKLRSIAGWSALEAA